MSELFSLHGVHSIQKFFELSKVSPVRMYGHVRRWYYMACTPTHLPRFAHLGRIALIHYLGPFYNPETIELKKEVAVRVMIKLLIEKRIREKGPRDWKFADEFLKDNIGKMFDLDLNNGPIVNTQALS